MSDKIKTVISGQIFEEIERLTAAFASLEMQADKTCKAIARINAEASKGVVVLTVEETVLEKEMD